MDYLECLLVKYREAERCFVFYIFFRANLFDHAPSRSGSPKGQTKKIIDCVGVFVEGVG